jgi:hypothetical protein
MTKLCQRVQNSKTEPRYTANPIPITPKSLKEVKSIGLRDLRALCKDVWTVLERVLDWKLFALSSV